MDKERIKDLLNLARLNKELRQKNEEKLLTKTKYKEALTEFHEPVIEQFKTHDQAIENLLHNTSSIQYIDPLPELPEAESSPEASSTPRYKYRADDLDEGLDISFLKQNEFKLPSEIAADVDAINSMLEKLEKQSKYLGSWKGKVSRSLKKERDDLKIKALQEEMDLYDSSLSEFRKYREKLKVLKAGSKVFKIKGDGLLTELNKLTDKIIRGNKNKKVYNQIVSILDLLCNEGTLTKEDVKRYYEKFLSI